MKLYQIRVGPNPMTSALIKKRQLGHRDTQGEQTPCDDSGKYGCKPKNAKGHHQPLETPEGTNLADTLILNFWLLEP